MTHADRQHPAPAANPRDANAAGAAPAAANAGSGAPVPKGSGKKSAAADGEDAPPDGSALPLIGAALAAAATLLATAPTGASAPGGDSLASVTLAATTAATAAADACATASAGAAGTASPALPLIAASPTPDNAAGASPAPTTGAPGAPVAPAAAPAAFRAVTDQSGAAPLPAPLPAALSALAAPVPAVAVAALPAAAAAATAPKFAVTTTLKAGQLAPASMAPTGTEAITASAQTAHAVAPLLAADTSIAVAAANSAADNKVEASAVATAALAPQAPTTPATPTVTQVATPVGSSDWPQQLGERVAVLVNQNLSNASIKLSPAHLGPLEIRIALSDGQANISFTTHSQVTREALEAAAPKLREALGAQGFGTVNVDVSQQQFRDRAPQSSQYGEGAPLAADAIKAPMAPTAAAGVVRSPRSAQRLDAYA